MGKNIIVKFNFGLLPIFGFPPPCHLPVPIRNIKLIPKIRRKVSQEEFSTETICRELFQYAEVRIDGGEECSR